jgi:hypothetical protein
MALVHCMDAFLSGEVGMATKEWKLENKEKLREYRRKWYANNKQAAKAAVKQRKEEIRLWFNEYKATLKCSYCSEKDPACLDFHHIDPAEKAINVPWAVDWGWSVERIKREIDKCIVLCANCHRKNHWS